MFKGITEFTKKLFERTFERTDEQGTTEEDLFDDEPEIQDDCSVCELRHQCVTKRACEKGLVPKLDGIDTSKDTLLIIDDNEGVVSFLKDDIEYFFENDIIKRDEINLLALTGTDAAFALQRIYKRGIDIKIKWAIIDITLGGSKMTENGNIKLTGVDVFEEIFKHTPEKEDFKFLFYTGNNLNPYIKSNEKLIEQFKVVKNEGIKKYVLFKTSIDIKSRRSYISKFLFGKKI